ncbi:MAG: serine hydrolase domain-containing protein [Pyrinomonadaceae bacterium]
MYRSLKIFFLITLVCAVTLAQSKTATQTGVVAELQNALDAEIAANPSLPGELLHLRVPGRGIDLSLASGVFDRESKRLLEPHHTFRVASVTKSFVATSVLRLIEDGKLGFDDSIAKHLPAEYVDLLRKDGYAVDTITIRHLLTHTSGIHDYATDQKYLLAVQSDPMHRWTRSEQVNAAMVWGQPLFEPGKGYRYSDTGYILLGEIVERITKLPLPQAVRKLLDFQKLGLDETYFESLEKAPPNAKALSHPYYGHIDGMTIDPSVDLYGGGGIVSTVEDLTRFYRAIFQKGFFKRDSTLQTMLTVPTTNEQAPGGPYAMGISKRIMAGNVCWGHTGFWGTSVYHCPGPDITIARHYNQAEPDERFIFATLFRNIFSALGKQAIN